MDGAHRSGCPIHLTLGRLGGLLAVFFLRAVVGPISE